MGQRTFILLKRNYGNNKSRIDLIHEQWGIGKVMPMYFMQEMINSSYSLERTRYYKKDELPLETTFTFEPLSNSEHNYVYNMIVDTDDSKYDIWNKDVRKNFARKTDNNNGGMLIEVTQRYEHGSPVTFGHKFDIKVGFCLGYEETCMYIKGFKDCIEVEHDFERLVSVDEYVKRTFSTGGRSNRVFVNSFKNLCQFWGVEFVVDEVNGEDLRKKVRAIAKLYLSRHRIKGQELEIPKELQLSKEEIFA